MPKSAHETTDDYNCRCTHVIHTKTKTKTLGLLKLHDHYRNACSGLISRLHIRG